MSNPVNLLVVDVGVLQLVKIAIDMVDIKCLRMSKMVIEDCYQRLSKIVASGSCLGWSGIGVYD